MEIYHHISPTEHAGVAEIWKSISIWTSASFWQRVTTSAPFNTWQKRWRDFWWERRILTLPWSVYHKHPKSEKWVKSITQPKNERFHPKRNSKLMFKVWLKATTRGPQGISDPSNAMLLQCYIIVYAWLLQWHTVCKLSGASQTPHCYFKDVRYSKAQKMLKFTPNALIQQQLVHRPTMFHTATVRPTRSGPSILYNTSLKLE